MTLRNTLLSNSMSVRFRHWKLPSQTTRLECAKVPHVTFNFTFRKSSSKPPPIRLLTTPLSTSGSETSISKQSSASGLAVLCGGSWSRAACFWSRSLSCERTISWCSSRRAASSDMACDVRDCVRENHVFDLCSKTVCVTISVEKLWRKSFSLLHQALRHKQNSLPVACHIFLEMSELAF